MSAPPEQHVFGPVPSRRLGRSLGVDLVPFKTCTYDCVYCQLGRTTQKTVRRRAWVPIHRVLAGVWAALESEPDWITVAGSGEPTLHCGLGSVIRDIKRLTSIPVAVLTNGSLLWRRDVREDLREADLVMPSLDAPDAGLFAVVNRPHRKIGFERMVSGLGQFRREFPGRCWLEVFLLADLTSGNADVERLAALADEIRPELVQLNTVARPPAEEFAQAVSRSVLDRLASLFTTPVEIIAETPPARVADQPRVADARHIRELVERRPCTVEQIAAGLGIGVLDALHRVNALVAVGAVERFYYNGNVFIAPARAGVTRKEHDESSDQRTGT
jgi:wyosine [tRNA(Phe)-imidazoG37] synthetase (radical SAM superfamily)